MRLSKLAKDLNIGIQTLIDYIKKKTDGAENWGPMSQVPDDIYDLIQQEFSKSKSTISRATKAELIERMQTKAKINRMNSSSEIPDNSTTRTSSSYSIGFKNFRRFENFPTMDLGDITMLVGGNNSGKSTMVKAALLVKNFINSKNNEIMGDGYSGRPWFNFDVAHTQIGNFKNALYAQAKDNHIVFEYKEAGVKYCVVVSGERELKDKTITYGYVDSFSMEILDAIYFLDFLTMRMSVTFQPEMRPGKNKQYIKNEVEGTKRLIESRKALLSKETDFDKIIALKKEIELLESHVLEDENPAISIELPIPTVTRPYFNYFVYDVLEMFKQYGSEPISWQIEKNSAEYNRIKAEKQAIQERSQHFFQAGYELTKSLEHSIEYIYAHNVSQEVFFKSSDKNDAMAQILHGYMRLRIQTDDPEHKFVQEWMRKFEIGEDYEITSYEGGAYSIDIIDTNGMTMPLSTKGMGSIQIMTLLLQLAGFIRKYKAVRFEKPTILIEEPEQNLHPKLQSLLGELFWTLSKDPFGLHFIIETHSEYLIRKTQVIVSNLAFADDEALNAKNPFKVCFLPVDRDWYDMEYRTDGKFRKKFDKGFFDVSADLVYEIM